MKPQALVSFRMELFTHIFLKLRTSTAWEVEHSETIFPTSVDKTKHLTFQKKLCDEIIGHVQCMVELITRT